MTPSPDLIEELQASRPTAPAALRARVRETAAGPARPPLSVWTRFPRPIRRVALVAVPAVLLVSIVGAGVVGFSGSERQAVGGENAPTPVLVAKELIPKGTPGSEILRQSTYAPTTLPRKEVEVGAIADPSLLAGHAAAADIFPGQQITATDLAGSDTASFGPLTDAPQVAATTPTDVTRDSTTAGANPDRAQRVSATLTVEVRNSDAVSQAAQDAIGLTRRLGGHVVSSSVTTGEQAGATMTVRVPVAKVQQAIAGLSELGRIVSQQVTIDDLQTSLDALERRQASVRNQIARIGARLDAESLEPEERAVLQTRLQRLQRELRELRRGITATSAEARMSTIELTVVTPDAGAVAPAPSRLERTLDEALNVLVWEGVIVLALAIVIAPIALLGLAAWLGQRLYRRREDERLLAS